MTFNGSGNIPSGPLPMLRMIGRGPSSNPPTVLDLGVEGESVNENVGARAHPPTGLQAESICS